jgi:formate transporter
MSELYGSDAYAPREVTLRLEAVGVAKARMALLALGFATGAVLVVLTYFVIYRRGAPPDDPATPAAPTGPSPEK